MNSVRKSSFRPNILTCFLTHGFLDDYKGLEAIKDAYLKQGFQANIIVMDWSALSQPRFPKNFVELFGILFSYKDVLNNLEPIAMRIAMFIQMLVHNNIATLNKLHLIGHSLGAHISGNVGKHIRTQLFPGMKAERVTGLDPAGPAFVPPLLGPVIPMDPADANFVDSIHSDADLNGIPIDDGIVDFFPNGGQDQPGCFPISDCSHKYAINIYAASVSKKYVGCQCDIHFLSTPALGSFSLGSITLDRCLLPCIYPTYLGPYCSHEAKGDFYLKAPNPP
ncbi:phospholipase A1 member A [Folsomia candida]|nr:phospholipase A1 member A [Folsomia candida]